MSPGTLSWGLFPERGEDLKRSARVTASQQAHAAHAGPDPRAITPVRKVDSIISRAAPSVSATMLGVITTTWSQYIVSYRARDGPAYSHDDVHSCSTRTCKARRGVRSDPRPILQSTSEINHSVSTRAWRPRMFRLKPAHSQPGIGLSREQRVRAVACVSMASRASEDGPPAAVIAVVGDQRRTDYAGALPAAGREGALDLRAVNPTASEAAATLLPVALREHTLRAGHPSHVSNGPRILR